jgi:DNA polymerase III subunit alpha
VFEQIIDTTVIRRRERDQGVMSLFGEWADDTDGADAGAGGTGSSGFDERLEIPDIEYDKSDRLRHEKEMLGLYVSDHPLFGVEAALQAQGRARRSPSSPNDGRRRPGRGGGVSSPTWRASSPSAGDQMAVFVLEDLEANIEVTVFPRTLTEQGHKLVDDVIVSVSRDVSTAATSRGSV